MPTRFRKSFLAALIAIAVNSFTVAHRNAANSADVSTANPFGVAVFATIPIQGSWLGQVNIANQNERVAVRINANATAAKIWQADMTVLPCP